MAQHLEDHDESDEALEHADEPNHGLDNGNEERQDDVDGSENRRDDGEDEDQHENPMSQDNNAQEPPATIRPRAYNRELEEFRAEKKRKRLELERAKKEAEEAELERQREQDKLRRQKRASTSSQTKKSSSQTSSSKRKVTPSTSFIARPVLIFKLKPMKRTLHLNQRGKETPPKVPRVPKPHRRTHRRVSAAPEVHQFRKLPLVPAKSTSTSFSHLIFQVCIISKNPSILTSCSR